MRICISSVLSYNFRGRGGGVLSRICHAPDALICKALRGAAVVFYCKPMITQQMGSSSSARRVKIFQHKKKKPLFKV